MTEKPIKKCPTCSGKVRRLIGAGAGILFKGSGFYQTDYRSSQYHKQAAADKKSEKSEPKPESKNKESVSALPKKDFSGQKSKTAKGK